MNKLKKIFVFSREDWEEKRKNGLMRYVLVDGLIHIGLIIGLITSIMMHLNDVNYDFGLFSITKIIGIFFDKILYFTIGGVILVIFNWYSYESRYKEKK